MKITSEQVHKYNAQCKNGFEFDVYHFQCMNEKQFIKFIELNNNDIVKATIEYYDNIPTLHIHEGYSDGRFATFSGLGQWFKLGDYQKTKRVNILIALTEKITDAFILSKVDERILKNSRVV